MIQSVGEQETIHYNTSPHTPQMCLILPYFSVKKSCCNALVTHAFILLFLLFTPGVFKDLFPLFFGEETDLLDTACTHWF